MDDTQQELETSAPSSDAKTNTSSTGADTEINADDVIQVKKTDWESTQKELTSIKTALKKERELKKQNISLSHVEEKEEKTPRKVEDVRAIIREERQHELDEERQGYEVKARDIILKRFPSLEKDNEYFLDTEVVEAYNDLLGMRIRRGQNPRTQADVEKLLERAIRITHPELLESEAETHGDRDNGYDGLSSGISKRPVASERLSSADKKFRESIDALVK